MKSITPDKQPSAPPVPSAGWQIVMSLVLLMHLAAVVAAPLAVEPSSLLAGSVWQWFRPYLDAAYLNHGYKFFAPDPGPSHLVRYELELVDGTRREGVFPNLNDQWPRLLYHRHMMLADRLGGPAGTPWIDAYAQSYAKHLLAAHDARQVTLYLRRHAIPFPNQVQQGMKLDDPSLYQERKLVTSTAGDLPELID